MMTHVTKCLIAITVALALGTAAYAADQAAPAAAKSNVVSSGSWKMTLPLGLEADAAFIPEDNPMSDDKILLGKLLYFDRRLSKDGTISCASCHIPYHGFADPHPTSAGVGFKTGGRNSPTVINRLFSADQFWDGRAASLEEQAAGPMTNPVEMQMESHEVVVAKLKGVKGYAPLFEKAFGDSDVRIDRITKAIAAYERTVVSGNSPFDRYQAGDKSAMSPSAVRGWELFNGKANCKTCHAGFNFTDENYRNIGVGMDKPKPDIGRAEISKKPEDVGAFKTPTLRNIVQTAPYMHDGSEETLAEVVEFYDKGGIKNPTLSADIKPLKLSAQEKQDLVAFMEALTGDATNMTPPDKLPQ